MTLDKYLIEFILCKALILQIIILVIGVYLINSSESLRQQFFVWIYMKIQKIYAVKVKKYKQELFAPLRHFSSLDKSLRNRGVVRILEVGVGPGMNFGFYPKNARVILVDPNPHFAKHVEENRAKHPQVIIERIIIGGGEDLGVIEDGSVDVVITTAVLCSVQNVRQTLLEIHRVLAPGGKYFFMEHVIAAEGSWHRLAQKLAFRLWKSIFCGCHITRDSEKSIRMTNFVETEFKYFKAELPLYIRFVAPHIYGTAQKNIISNAG